MRVSPTDFANCRAVVARAKFNRGAAPGLLLGPFGLPIAAQADAAQDQERQAFNREIELRCMTNPPPPKPKVEPVTEPGSPYQNQQSTFE